MEVATPTSAAAPTSSSAPSAAAGAGSGGAGGGSRTLSVAGQSNVKSLAGSIAHTSRAAAPPILQAVGAASLNQAIKAIAVARTFLEADDIDLDVEVSRVPDESIRNLLQLKLNKKPRAAVAARKDEPVDLRCAGTTETVALAGAIANNIREGARVRITAIGPVPVFRAVDAIVKARMFLQKDSVEISFVPSFTTIEAGEGERQGVVNALQLLIISNK